MFLLLYVKYWSLFTCNPLLFYLWPSLDVDLDSQNLSPFGNNINQIISENSQIFYIRLQFLNIEMNFLLTLHFFINKFIKIFQTFIPSLPTPDYLMIITLPIFNIFNFNCNLSLNIEYWLTFVLSIDVAFE